MPFLTAETAPVPIQRSRPPAFLVGAPRSGTSLVYKLLCLHPEAAYISNWVRKAPALPYLAVFNRLGARMPGARRQSWFGSDSNAYVYAGRRALVRRLFPMPVEGEPVFERCGFGVGDSTSIRITAGQAGCLRRSLSAITAFGGGRIMISKRIAHNQRIAALVEAFPEGRFVEIVRDGRAVALSLSKVDWWPDSRVWWYGGTPAEWAAEGKDPWELCAREWVEQVRLLQRRLEAVPPAQLKSLTYEELVASPVEVMGELAEFCGLGRSDSWLRAMEEMSFPDMNEAWRSKLDDAAIGTIEQVQREELRRLGYA